MKSSAYVYVGVRLEQQVEWPMAPQDCPRDAAKITFTRAIDEARLLEQLGFDWVSVSEHHYMPGMLTPNALVLAGAIAQATSTITVALLGPILPLNNPVRVAEEVAMLDGLSNGRIMCLPLRGTPNEVLSYTINPDESREMTQEGIDLMVRTWTEPAPFAWYGRHYCYRMVASWPRTLQDPHPRLYGSGNSAESIAFAASRRMGIGISYVPIPMLAKIVGLYRDECAKAGWTPAKDDIIYRTHIHVSPTQKEAEETMPILDKSPLDNVGGVRSAKLQSKLAKGHVFNLPKRPALFGGADEVIEQFAELSRAGIGVVDLGFAWPTLSVEQHQESMRCYSEKVMPVVSGF